MTHLETDLVELRKLFNDYPKDFPDELRVIAETVGEQWGIAGIKIRGAANLIEKLEAALKEDRE